MMTTGESTVALVARRLHSDCTCIPPGLAGKVQNSMKLAGRRVPNAGSFKPGDPRINRSGRPRTGAALAEAIRERLSPSVALDLLAKFAADESIPAERRLATLLPWYQAGYTKPATDTNLTVNSSERTIGDELADPTTTPERRKELLDDTKAWLALQEGDG